MVWGILEICQVFTKGLKKYSVGNLNLEMQMANAQIKNYGCFPLAMMTVFGDLLGVSEV